MVFTKYHTLLTTHCTLHTTHCTLHATHYTPTYLSSKFTIPKLSLYTILQSILSQVQSKISPGHQSPFSCSQRWTRKVSSQSGLFFVSYNLYPGLIQDNLGGPPTLESIQSGPTLADQSGAGTYENSDSSRTGEEPIKAACYREGSTANCAHTVRNPSPILLRNLFSSFLRVKFFNQPLNLCSNLPSIWSPNFFLNLTQILSLKLSLNPLNIYVTRYF